MSQRSIHIGGNVTGSAVVAGDHNIVSNRQVTPPPPESVDMAATIAALRDLLLALDPPRRERIESALKESAEDAAEPEPDKDRIGQSLTRAVDYATKANGFAEQAQKLAPHIAAAASWLGPYGQKLLDVMGLG